MKWGKDQEERAAVARKAHDAYATASAAREAISGVVEDCDAIGAELVALRLTIGRLETRIMELEQARFLELERPRAAKATRKAA